MNKHVEYYLELGLTPCPVRPGGKQPIYNGWPQTDSSTVIGLFEQNPDANIGIVLGDASGGVIDVDLDHPVAVKIGPALLPSTAFQFGRASKPQSHHFYAVASAGCVERFTDPRTKEMIVELRGNGHMTVVPGSTHPSGEAIEFDVEPGTPATADWGSLRRSCALIAIANVVSAFWNKGQRHNLSVMLAGFLAAAGVTESDANSIVDALVLVTNDEEPEDRLRSVATTYERSRRGEKIQGRTALAAQIGNDSVEAFERWLGPNTSPTGSRHADIDPNKVGPLPSLTTMSTDLGASGAFADQARGRILYDGGNKRWFAANNDVFEPITPEQVTGLVIRMVVAASEQANSSTLGIVRSLHSNQRIKAIPDLAKSELRAVQAEFDTDPLLVGCQNGVLNLTEGRLVQPDSIVTKRLGTRFDPAERCPTFERFVSEIFDDDESLIQFVQRAIGYTLTGLTSEQCLFVMIGIGANGKSTLAGLLYRLMGDYAGTVPMHTLMVSQHGRERTEDLASLRGVRFALAQEGEEGERLAEAKIKIMTGGDPIACRRLYGNYETFTPQFKLWLATNELPKITSAGDAIWRRIHVIPFPVTFPPEKRDPKLQEKLLAELPGILNWVLEGYRAWTEQGLNPPETVTSATAEYRGDSDTVGTFVDICCVRDPQARTSMNDLYNAYGTYCARTGVDALTNAQFGKGLTRLRFEVLKTNTGNVRIGIRVRD